MEAYSGKTGKGPATLLVKVKAADYIPEGISIRTKISSHIFTTAEATPGIISKLEKDNNVVSFSVNRKISQIK